MNYYTEKAAEDVKFERYLKRLYEAKQRSGFKGIKNIKQHIGLSSFDQSGNFCAGTGELLIQWVDSLNEEEQ